jgi:hypothetical protein
MPGVAAPLLLLLCQLAVLCLPALPQSAVGAKAAAVACEPYLLGWQHADQVLAAASLQDKAVRLLPAQFLLQAAQQLQGVQRLEAAQQLQGVQRLEAAQQLQGVQRLEAAQQLQGVQRLEAAQELQGVQRLEAAQELQGVQQHVRLAQTASLQAVTQGCQGTRIVLHSPPLFPAPTRASTEQSVGCLPQPCAPQGAAPPVPLLTSADWSEGLRLACI